MSPDGRFCLLRQPGFSRFRTQSPRQDLVLLSKPALTLLGMEPFHSEEPLYQGILTHAQISLACALLVAIWLHRTWLSRRCHCQRLCSPFVVSLPCAMLLVVGPGLRVVEDSTFRYTPMLRVQLFRSCSYCCQRDPLLILEERVHARFHQINGTLAKLCVNFL